jgi:hypothetical protein
VGGKLFTGVGYQPRAASRTPDCGTLVISIPLESPHR